MTRAERAAALAAMVDEFVARGWTRADAEARVLETTRDAFDVITVDPPAQPRRPR
jgi:hypothetical protein